MPQGTEFTYEAGDGCALYAKTIGHGPALVLLHGGGPDHRSLLPLAERLADRHAVVLPDVRGYGRSVCADPAGHTWAQYADDVAALLDHLNIPRTVVGGTGLGATIAQRTCVDHPNRVQAAILISVEDIEDDQAKQAETAMMEAFAARVRADGIEAAWEPILPTLAPVIGTLVRDAIPRSDPASIAAAAAIGHDRAFRSVDDLATISTPTLIIPGMDARHPAALAETLARVLPDGYLAPVAFSADLRTADDLAEKLAPAIREFLAHTAEST
jgi:3-oxoadipate enol-lactonase